MGADSRTPRAIVHKKILDVAASEPNASLEAIAAEVSGASIDLVERVFDEYGDPCEESTGDAPVDADGHPTATETMSAPDPVADEPTEPSENGPDAGPGPGVDRDDLSDKQLRTLRAVAAAPDCSQSELAEQFDVTRATISRWLNDIPGFEWSRRAEIAAAVIDDADGPNGGPEGAAATAAPDDTGDVAPAAPGATDSASTEPEPADADPTADRTLDPETTDGALAGDAATTDGAGASLAALRDQVARIERRLDRLEADADGAPDAPDGDESLPIDPDLAHRVVHACMRSDRIDEDEELRLLELFMAGRSAD